MSSADGQGECPVKPVSVLVVEVTGNIPSANDTVTKAVVYENELLLMGKFCDHCPV